MLWGVDLEGVWRLWALGGKTFEDEGVSEISCLWVGSMGEIKTKTKACCALVSEV